MPARWSMLAQREPHFSEAARLLELLRRITHQLVRARPPLLI